MQKQLENTLSQITMYSKMGKYISNKILKYNKKTKSSQKPVYASPPKEQYLRVKTSAEHKSSKVSTHRNESTNYMTHPPVGYYKLNHSQIEKHPRQYNFDRSVPHFYRQKFHCNETKPVTKDYPDLSTSKPYTKGMIELKRSTGRNDIKSSIRKTLENPHEKRFEMINHHKGINSNRAQTNFDKSTSRDMRMFKNAEYAPQYQIYKDYNPKRLDTHILPFEKVSPRNQNHMILKSGISDFFNQAETSNETRLANWKKMLPRQKTGLLPSYMDKNINTRSSITLLNLKTLEMNSTNLKKMPLKSNKESKKLMKFIEEDCDDKQNIARNSVH